MKAYLALIFIYLKLTLREKSVLFFNYVFPLIFFFTFGELMGPSASPQVVATVLVLGALGSGLFGAGIRTVAEREANILRRYKVAPITPTPLLVASIVTGWILLLPSIILTLTLAHVVYGMPFPERMGSLLMLISLGAIALRGIGLIVASVVNSVAESNIVIQLMYMPMLFLSGATFPVSILPLSAQIFSQYLPASHLYSGVQAIVIRKESLLQNWTAAVAMVLSTVVATFLSSKLFRWEKNEKISRRALLWIFVVFVPFLMLGTYQAYSRENIAKSKIYDREMRRNRARLIRNARIFVGDGQVIENGGVLIRNRLIDKVYAGSVPEAKELDVDGVEANGKTLLPGLIDLRVLLAQRGGADTGDKPPASEIILRNAAAYLYSGVTSVAFSGPPTPALGEALRLLQSGERAGAEVFASGTGKDAYIPGLTSIEAAAQLREGNLTLLDRSLVAQVGPRELLQETRKQIDTLRKAAPEPRSMSEAMNEMVRAYKAKTLVAMGTESGKPLLIHGPAIHRELQLWVQAGIPAADALKAATYNGAHVLGIGHRAGLIRTGYDATLLLVSGNPTQDIMATEQIDSVFLGASV